MDPQGAADWLRSGDEKAADEIFKIRQLLFRDSFAMLSAPAGARKHSRAHVRLTAVKRHAHTEAYFKRLSEMSTLTSSFVGVAPKVAAMKPKKAQRVAVTAKAVDVDSLAPPTTRVAPRVPEGAYFSGSLDDTTARS